MLNLDGVLAALAILACVAFGALVDAQAIGIVSALSFVAATALLVLGLWFEPWRLPLVIAAHWFAILGLGASLKGGALPMGGSPALIAVLTGTSIYALARRRWRGWEAYWAIHGYDVEAEGVSAGQDEVPVVRQSVASDELSTPVRKHGVRERIEPRFD